MIVHIKKSPYDVYIGRPSRTFKRWGWGNPWIINQHGTREQVIAKFEKWLDTGENDGNLDATEERRQWILDNLPFLKDKTLGCFCNWPQERCHGEILIKKLNDRN